MKNVVIALLICAGICAGCSRTEARPGNKPQTGNSQTIESEAVYHKIPAEEADKMMSASEDYIILDVRTQAEFREKRIEGAILIPDTEIEARAEKELPDRNKVIFVYCRSGGRSARAAGILADLGYTNVFDIGGIVDWPYKTTGD